MEREKGKYYTLEEARQLVKFCKQHQVLLIPEIDMPGHSAAFERTFKTDMQSEKGTQILKDIIDEVCATFDVPYRNRRGSIYQSGFRSDDGEIHPRQG